ncbi:putative RNA-directed DNA polymerase [Helianthus annuus]|nr:putative RNA-directed DNA polymerase [Helianthus annuus]
MVRPVTREEVKKAMFSIGENKAPGPDGFTSAFFKHAWDTVGEEVTDAVLTFFDNGQLLKQINHTIIALVPKKDAPNSVLDYRPISCCNVLFKCISKIITERIKGKLESLVSINQSAFVPGRKISDNILLTQELMHNYHTNRGPSRCALKIDIQKAYDTVNWSFLETVLTRFGFHRKMVKWIMTCVSTVSYSLCINGNIHGFFYGKRGLRQGDPLSPYLFTLVMEVLSLLLQHAARTHASFKFHSLCAKQRIINVSFADDLFVFAHGDRSSVKVLRDALGCFTKISGLVPSAPKSTIFFCNVPSQVKMQILGLMPFQEGSLPVRYLGVPLISTRLAYRDCKILIERVKRRIDNWMSRSLSFAGRLQLINSVLGSMYTYWASVFMLPVRIVKELEKSMRRFLWNGGSQGNARSKVAWSNVCLPKDEGGLGIRSINDVNVALLAGHVWSIITNRPSLWVQWIHSYKLKGTNFWEVTKRGSVSWGWRHILAIRDRIRPYVWMSIRSGRQTNAWSDNWCSCSPLRSFISPRAIANAGLNLRSTVADIIDDTGQWKWPQAWFDIFPVLINIPSPHPLVAITDRCSWKDLEGNLCHFRSWEVWNTLRRRGDRVDWVESIWFSQCIPRHSFHLWLVMNNKLKTQDRMATWEAGSATNLILMCCPLCYHDRDSRDHLFFQCPFATKVWESVRKMVNMENVNNTWSSVMQWMVQNATSRTIDRIIGKILIAATTYYVWQERNSRLFSSVQRTPDMLSHVIISTVRLKIMGFKLGSDRKHRKVLDTWQISMKNLDCDPG